MNIFNTITQITLYWRTKTEFKTNTVTITL